MLFLKFYAINNKFYGIVNNLKHKLDINNVYFIYIFITGVNISYFCLIISMIKTKQIPLAYSALFQMGSNAFEIYYFNFSNWNLTVNHTL